MGKRVEIPQWLSLNNPPGSGAKARTTDTHPENQQITVLDLILFTALFPSCAQNYMLNEDHHQKLSLGGFAIGDGGPI